MTLHKLTAGDGYSYLTRQVAAMDATDKGHVGLADYYSQKGEAPGTWLGSGLVGLDGLEVGGTVTAEQMKALFGEGRHPNADAIEAALIGAGLSPKEVLAATSLGRQFYVYENASEFRKACAEAFAAHNLSRPAAENPRWDDPVPEDVRARIRTEIGAKMFTAQHGRAPLDARELSGFVARVSRQSTTAVAGYDLTFSPVKSVSSLWALAPKEMAQQIEAAHHAAVKDAVGWLEKEASYTRMGANGVRQVDVTGLVATAFVHRDSRAGDPDLHTHVAVSNKVQTVDGKWLALDGRIIFKANVSASERYNTRLEAELRARLGLQFAASTDFNEKKRPIREVVGAPAQLNKAWSRRRAAIEVRQAELQEAFQASHGRAPTPIESLALAQQANLDTRAAKHEPHSLDEQRREWRGQAEQILGGPDAIGKVLTETLGGRPDKAQRLTRDWVAGAADDVVRTVEGSRAHWQMWHVRAEAERRARSAGFRLEDLDKAVSEVVAAALNPERSVALQGLPTVAEPAELRRRDGSSMYITAGAQLFTSSAIMAAERALVDAARRVDGRVVEEDVVEIGLLESAANKVTLNPAQKQLVHAMATSGARLQLAIAPAGSGKTTAMSVLARVWRDSGGAVLGLAPSAKAAAGLGEQLGTHTDTLAKLVYHLDNPGKPRPKWMTNINKGTLLVIDEAGMAGTIDLSRVVQFALSRRASVRLIGDDQQLAAVAAGGVLRDIAETVGAVTLSQLVRFKNRDEAAATLALRAGDPAAIGYYLDRGRVHVGSLTTVAESAYRAWSADREAGLDSIMLAPTRELVSALNHRAREDRLVDADPDHGRSAALADGNHASRGDLIITRQNNRLLAIASTDWVKNGDRWLVDEVLPDGAITATHLETQRNITLPRDYVRESVDLGYASTVHGAQGVTADTAHMVASGDESRQLLYVALSRGRAENHVYVVTADDHLDPDSVIRRDTLLPQTATNILVGIVERDQAQQSATTVARELLSPGTSLGQAAARYEDALGLAAETVLGTAGMLKLDEAADEIVPDLSTSPAWPTLRAHLAVLGADGHDPVAVLTEAAQRRHLNDAVDPAAVIDWRIDPAGTKSLPEGPLPWLTGIPDRLRLHPQWGQYLIASAERILALSTQVQTAAQEHTPTSAPIWAKHLLEDKDLHADLAVWRAANEVPDADRRPTGAPQLAARKARTQQTLQAQATTVLGDPKTATRTWAPRAAALGLATKDDPYWPELAARLTALDRAGVDSAALLKAAVEERPLPDDMPSAVVWWRISRHLNQAAVAATENSGAASLRPQWADDLTTILGQQRAERVMADPAWPALVAAVDVARRAGWTVPALVVDLSDHAGAPLPAAELAEALVWHVGRLTDPAPQVADQESTPPIPEEDLLPPDDLHLLDLDTHADTPGWDLDWPDNWANEPALDEPPPEFTDAEPLAAIPEPEGYEDALFQAATRRQWAGDPEIPDGELMAPLAEQAKWDAAPHSKERLLELNVVADEFYRAHLDDAWARDYLVDRLGTDLHGSPFTAGYAPAGWTHLTSHLRSHGASDAEIIAAGLGKMASTGRVIDLFRDRLVLPIRTADGIVGFVGRRNPRAGDDQNAGPKYINTPATDLFDKGAQLFGATEASAALTSGAQPTLVEGPFDAIATTLAGQGRHVGLAPLGTSFTEAQAATLRPYIGPDRPGILVATDGDLAGSVAAERAFWILTARGDNPTHATMPAGLDPADILRELGQNRLAETLNSAPPLSLSLLRERLTNLPVGSAARAAADIIAATPPSEWANQIQAVTIRAGLPEGLLHLDVADSANARTDDPISHSANQIREIGNVRTRLQIAQTHTELASATTKTTQRRKLPENISSASPLPANDDQGSNSPPVPPTTRWAAMVRAISPALLAGADWPALAATIDKAHQAGHDVASTLPRIAAASPLPAQSPARDLAYRLLDAATELEVDHPTPTQRPGHPASSTQTKKSEGQHHGPQASTPRR